MENKNEINSNEKIVKRFLLIFKQISFQNTFKEGITSLENLINENISNEKNMNFILQQIYNQLLNLHYENKKIVISIIPFICNILQLKINPYIEKIINIFQKSFCEESSKIFNIISKSFGDSIKIIFQSKEKIINNSNSKNYFLDENELEIFNQFQKFCFLNSESSNEINQICGILCLNSFIENCSYNYSNDENIKKNLDVLLNLIEKKNYIPQLELLNCLITLIFLSEAHFSKYASVTLYKIIDFITDKEWMKRKLALNIVYTLVYYCGNEIISLKDFLLEFLMTIKNDSNKEVKEVCLQIIKMLNNENSFNISFLSENNSFFGKENSSLSPTNNNNKTKIIINQNKNNIDNKYNYTSKNISKCNSVVLNNNENSISDFGSNHINNISSISNFTEKSDNKLRKSSCDNAKIQTRNSNLISNKNHSHHIKNNSNMNNINNHNNNNFIKTYGSNFFQKKKFNKQYLINNNNKQKNKFVQSHLSNSNTPKKTNLNIKKKQKYTSCSSPNLFNKKILKKENKVELAENEFNLNAIREYRENIVISNLKEEIEFLKKEIALVRKNKKIKKDLKNYIKQNKYIEAFKNAISLEKISNVYYIIKHYQFNSIKENIPEDILSDISKILCEDILECENIRLVTKFIIENICEKKKTLNKMIGKKLGNVYKQLNSKSQELCFCKLDIDNFSIIIDYFSKY